MGNLHEELAERHCVGCGEYLTAMTDDEWAEAWPAFCAESCRNENGRDLPATQAQEGTE